MAKVAVLASGRGSNLEALLSAQARHRLGPARVAVVISDRKEAPALVTAHSHGVEALFLDPAPLSRQAYDEKLRAALQERGIDLVVLAGFMRVLTPGFVRHFRDRIMNIHPALLPSFPGLRAQHQALLHGVRIAGATTHFVDEGVDSGPIILQAAVPVRSDDTEETLCARILESEHRILPASVRLWAEGRLAVAGRSVEIKGDAPFPHTSLVVPEVAA